MKLLKCIVCCMLPLFLLLAAGCGGSGSGNGSPTTVSGVAAAGSPLSGTVSLKDSSLPAKERYAAINTDGSFAFDLTGLTPPYLLKATGTANNLSTILYSMSSAGGTANINPLSSLAVALAHGSGDLGALYGAPDPLTLRDVSHALAGAVRDVQTALRPTLEKFGAAGVNFITDPYVANHRGLDLMLDLASIRTTSTGVVVMQDRKSSLGEQCPLGQFASGSYDFITTPLPTAGTLFVMPAAATVSAGGTIQFSAFIVGSQSREFSWSVVESDGGSITGDGRYTAPLTAGTYHVKATSVAEPGKSTTVPVTVESKNIVTVVHTAPGVYTVMAQNFVNIVGVEIEITYDTATLANPRIAQGALTAQTMFIPNPRFKPNMVKLACMSISPIAGSGSLATITFDLLGSPPGTVQISRLVLAPTSGTSVPTGGGDSGPLPVPNTEPATVPGPVPSASGILVVSGGI